MIESTARYIDIDSDKAPLAFRLRTPLDPDQAPVVMLHGLSGDEDSMWALESALPSDGIVVAPRGLHPQRQGGYAWNSMIQAWPPVVDEFSESVDRLEALLDWLEAEHSFERARMILMGFSNGAAMAFAAAMTPLSVQPAGIIVIAGHLPQGDLEPLRRIPIYWGHGSKDPFIPATIAHADVERLEQLGTQIQYCEADVGHKLGAECLGDLKDWFKTHFSLTKEHRL
jgi:phospholipase/carboxylesterase